MSTDGILVYLNPASVSISGYKPEELMNTNAFALVHHDHVEKIQSVFFELLQKPYSSMREEFQIIQKNGALKWVEATATNLLQEASIGGILVNFRDITMKKQFELALSMSEAKYKTVIESSSQGIVVYTPERIVFCNEAAQNIFGYDEDFLRKKTISELMSLLLFPDDMKKLRRRIADRLAGKSIAGKNHFRIIRGNGEMRWIDSQASRITFQDETAILASFVDITENKRTEFALKESEARYRRLVQNAPDIIYTLSKNNGIVLSCNRIFEQKTGWLLTQWIGKPMIELIHPDDVALALEKFNETISGKTPKPYELRVRMNTGGYLTAEIISAPLIEHGEIIGEFGIARDITEWKEREKKLQISNDILNSVANLVLVGNSRGEVIYASPSMKTILGYEPDEVLGDVWWKYSRQSDEERREAISLLISYATGEAKPSSEPYERTVLDNAGHPHIITWRDTKGPADLVIGVGYDVTEQKSLEKKILRFARMVEQSADSICVTDRDGVIEYVNPGFERTTGFPKAEVIGKTMRILKSGLHEKSFYQQMWKKILAGEVYEGTLINRRKNGELYYEEMTITPLADESGEITHCVSSGRDVTEKIKAEKYRERTTELLKDLSHRIMNVQEEERQSLSRELHDEVGQTMTALKINLLALRNTRIDGEERDRMQDSIGLVDELIKTIRNMSIKLRPTLLDDFGLVHAIRWYTERQAKRSTVTVDVYEELHGERPVQEVETTCFRVVQESMTNILRHARATRVRIELYREERSLHILINDNGVGFLLSEVQKNYKKGESLGLIGMQERVALVGGTMEIIPIMGEGTTIKAIFPDAFHEIE